MKKLLLILSLSLALASPAFALKKGERHPEPYNVMTKGQVIGQMQEGSTHVLSSYLLIAYKGQMYRCQDFGRGSKSYHCILLAPSGG